MGLARRICIPFVVTVVVWMVSCQMMPGGVSEEQTATSEVQDLVDAVRPQIERQLDGPVTELRAVKFRSQAVNGANYWIKVSTGSEYIHIKIYKHWNSAPELSNYLETGKSFEDKIEAVY